MTGQTSSNHRLALVTGATRGIGEAIARGLAREARGYRVIVSGRDVTRGKAIAAELGASGAMFQELDQTSDASIAAAFALIEAEGGLDVLINNAGASFDGFDAKVARKTLDVNFVGMMKLTERLLPLMREEGRIVMVSSGMGEVSCLGAALRKEVLDPALDRAKLVAFVDRFIDDVANGTHTRHGWPSNAYRVSKVAMNAYVRILARDLERDPRHILVNAACPGWVRTAMGGSHAPRSVEQGAKTPLFLATLPKEGATGRFFRDEAPIDW